MLPMNKLRVYNFQDLTNLRFGRLLATEYAGSGKAGALWECICDCGAKTIVQNCNLKSGHTKSCGCLAREITSLSNRTHGYTIGGQTPEYKIWVGIIKRCTNPNTKRWHRYGGRGITICERWRSFENFLTDMGTRPSNKHSIDRINNDGNYEPSNCRWATAKEQGANTSVNRWITINDQKLTATQWTEKMGLNNNTFYTRLSRGWSEERALLQSVTLK